MGACIFISYRRADAGGHAGRLYDRLDDWFEPGTVFFDQEQIDAGESFPDRIAGAIQGAKVALVVIGPDWLEEINSRVMTQKVDYVRREVTLALARLASGESITVLPVLVGGAKMPEPLDLRAELRDEIGALCERHALAFHGGQEEWESKLEWLRQKICSIPGVPAAYSDHRHDLRTLYPDFHQRLLAHTARIQDRLELDVPLAVNFDALVSPNGSVTKAATGKSLDEHEAISSDTPLAYLERTIESTRDNSETTLIEIFERWREGAGPAASGPVVVVGAGAQGKTIELCRLIRHIRDVAPDTEEESIPVCYLDLEQNSANKRARDSVSFDVAIMTRRTLRLSKEVDVGKIRDMLAQLPPSVFMIDIARALATQDALPAIFDALREFYLETGERNLVLVTYRTSGFDPIENKLTGYRDRRWRAFLPYKIKPPTVAQIETVMSSVDYFRRLSDSERTEYIEILRNDLLMLEHCRRGTQEASLRSREASFYDATFHWQEECEKLGIHPATVLSIAATICQSSGDLSIDPVDEQISECLTAGQQDASPADILEALASANIIRRQPEKGLYEFSHSDYVYFCAALWMRCETWETLLSRTEFESRLRAAILRVTTTPHALEVLRFLPGLLKRLSDLDEYGENELYNWLCSRFDSWGAPGADFRVDEKSVRISLMLVAELYLEMQLPGEQASQLIRLCESALSLGDIEARHRAIEQLVNIFFRQAMGVPRPGELRSLAAPRTVDALTRSVSSDLRSHKGWLSYFRLAVPWLLQRYVSRQGHASRLLQPLVSRVYPKRAARTDSLLVLLLVLAGQTVSTRSPIGASQKESEKLEGIRSEVVSFVLREGYSLLGAIKSPETNKGWRSPLFLRFVALVIYTHYRFNERPCNFREMKGVLFSRDRYLRQTDPAGGRVWLMRLARLFRKVGDEFQQEMDWLFDLCDRSQNGLVTWYAYTILSIQGNRPERAEMVVDLLDRFSRDAQAAGVRRYVAFHALRSLIFYSKTIRENQSFYDRASGAFKRIADEAFLGTSDARGFGHNLEFERSGVEVGVPWRLLKWVRTHMRGGRGIYDNEILLYYAQYLCQEDKSIDPGRKLSEIVVGYLEKCGGDGRIHEFEYVVDTMARVGIAEGYTTDALGVLNALQEQFPRLGQNRSARRAVAEAYYKVGKFQPRDARRARGQSAWKIRERQDIHDRAVAAEIYEPQSFYGDAVYQNSLFEERTQEVFAVATERAARARSMFDFFFAYTETVAEQVAHGRLPGP